MSIRPLAVLLLVLAIPVALSTHQSVRVGVSEHVSRGGRRGSELFNV